jgi:NAD+ kinase
MKIKSVGLIVANHRSKAVTLAAQAADWLAARQVPVLLRAEIARRLHRENLGATDAELAKRCELLVSLGGDGTFLAAARLAAPRGRLLLGAHLGGFGYLAQVPQAQFFLALEAALAGRFRVQERIMLTADVYTGADAPARWSDFALNEVVISKGAVSRLIPLRTRVGGYELSSFSADGIIIATPTGSTAYSLSAGGPVVDPTIRSIIMTPICAHTLSARPLVVPADQEIEVQVCPAQPGHAMRLTLDGQMSTELEVGDRVCIHQAPFSAKLVSFDDDDEIGMGWNFYDKLRTKLGWGERRR